MLSQFSIGAAYAVTTFTFTFAIVMILAMDYRGEIKGATAGKEHIFGIA